MTSFSEYNHVSEKKLPSHQAVVSCCMQLGYVKTVIEVSDVFQNHCTILKTAKKKMHGILLLALSISMLSLAYTVTLAISQKTWFDIPLCQNSAFVKKRAEQVRNWESSCICGKHADFCGKLDFVIFRCGNVRNLGTLKLFLYAEKDFAIFQQSLDFENFIQKYCTSQC